MVEHFVANENVEGSTPFSRSIFCRCDVNGSMTVSKTVRQGSNPCTYASYKQYRLLNHVTRGHDVRHYRT